MGTNPPPHSDELMVSFPHEHVLLLTMNRPESLNTMSPTLARDLNIVLNWFDNEASLWLVLGMEDEQEILAHQPNPRCWALPLCDSLK
jgi:hypothetical protein